MKKEAFQTFGPSLAGMVTAIGLLHATDLPPRNIEVCFDHDSGRRECRSQEVQPTLLDRYYGLCEVALGLLVWNHLQKRQT